VTGDSLVWAREYCRRGLPVVPIPAGQKAPRIAGWPDLRLGLDDLKQHFETECNVGVILDELSDSDLDCPEAVTLADLYLPATRAIFGRPSKPKSHRLYVAPGAVYERFVDPLTGDTLLELRTGRGHQTLFPPSVTGGERREWCGDVIAPRLIDAKHLHIAAGWLAIACLVARYVSLDAAERPDTDFVHLLDEIDILEGHQGKLGMGARNWLGMPEPDPPKLKSRPRKEQVRRAGSGSCRAEPDLGEMAGVIPNNEDWIGWNRLGLAFFAASNGSEAGFEAFNAFSQKSEKYDPAGVAERWSNYRRSPPRRIGMGSLVHRARQHGWTPRGRQARGN
jgi:hypothetical protein